MPAIRIGPSLIGLRPGQGRQGDGRSAPDAGKLVEAETFFVRLAAEHRNPAYRAMLDRWLGLRGHRVTVWHCSPSSGALADQTRATGRHPSASHLSWVRGHGAGDRDGRVDLDQETPRPREAPRKVQLGDLQDATKNAPGCCPRTTTTGTALWVSTLTVSLPSTIAETPRRPCEAITMASHPSFFAVSIIA